MKIQGDQVKDFANKKELNKEDIEQLWAVFIITRTCSDKNNPEYIQQRNLLLTYYYPLVTRVAENMSKKIKEVDFDDFIAWGTDGLFHAVDRFNPAFNNKFETYAIHRIRGAVLDNIRKVDWVPRLVRQRNNKLQKAKQSLESKLGRTATDEEMATHMGMELEDFIEMRDKANPTGCVSMYAGNSSNDSDFEEIQIESYQTDDASASNVLIREEMFKKLLSRNYTPFERQIVHMHYYENMTIKEIAQKTGYCESRISQLHAKIIDRLQRKIKMNPQYMAHLTSMLNA